MLEFHLDFKKVSNSTGLAIVSTRISSANIPNASGRKHILIIRVIRYHSSNSWDKKFFLKKSDGKGRKRRKIE